MAEEDSAYWETTAAVGTVGCCIYGVLVLAAVASRIWDVFHIRGRRSRWSLSTPGTSTASAASQGPEDTRARVSQLYHGFVVLFCVFRAVGCVTLNVTSETAATYIVVIRRLGFCLEFSAYSSIVYWWCVAYAGSGVEARRRSTRVFWLLLVCNAAAYVSAVLFAALWWVTTDQDEQRQWYGNVWYEAGVWTMIVVNVVTQIIVVALALLVCLKQRNETWFLRAGPRDVGGVLGCAAALFACCLLTTAMLLLRPLGYRVSNSALFYTATYFVPEITSTCVGLAVIHIGRHHTTGYSSDSGLVNELFREAHKGSTSTGRTALPRTLLRTNTASSSSSTTTASVRTPLLHTTSPAMPVRALNAPLGITASVPSAVYFAQSSSTSPSTAATPSAAAPGTSMPPILTTHNTAMQ